MNLYTTTFVTLWTVNIFFYKLQQFVLTKLCSGLFHAQNSGAETAVILEEAGRKVCLLWKHYLVSVFVRWYFLTELRLTLTTDIMHTISAMRFGDAEFESYMKVVINLYLTLEL